MTCDHYQHALLDLAARGAEPDPQLFAHMQACSSCHSAFENERSLFASIDSCLRASANAEIPPSFIPTLRAEAVQREAQRERPTVRGSGRITDRLVWASAFAAAAFTLFIFTRPDRRVRPQPVDEQSVTKRTDSPVPPPLTAAKPLQDANHQIVCAIAKPPAGKAVITLDKNSLQTESREPEILVPPDQEILLARYADQFRRRHQSSFTLLTELAPDQTAPLEVPLIQIAELDVKPLAPGQQIGQHIDPGENR